jgi:hypothetical protein
MQTMLNFLGDRRTGTEIERMNHGMVDEVIERSHIRGGER